MQSYDYKKRKQFAVAKAKVFLHLEAWVRVGRGIPHVKGYNRATATALLFQRINAFKKTTIFIKYFCLGMFGVVEEGPEASRKFFDRWVEEVKATVPAEKLLVFEAK
jgi:hypothetical protein